MTMTQELFDNLDELGVQIIGTGELLLRTAKEELEKKEKRIKDLELQLETINKPNQTK
jgi:archaellum component FlaC